MKILQLLSHDQLDSGGAIQAWLLSRELAGRNHDVTIAFDVRNDRRAAVRMTDAIRAIGCNPVGLPLHGFFGRTTGAARLKELLAEARFDVAHLHRKAALRRFLRVESAAPRTVAIANIGTSAKPGRKQTLRLAAPRVSRVVCVANALLPLLSAAGVPESKLTVVYGAFDEERFRDSSRKLDRVYDLHVPRSAFLVGMLANYAGKKGHHVMLDAAAHVLERRKDVYFTFAGGGEGENAFRAEVGRRGGELAERVRILGYVEDVPSYLRALDVLVCASTHGEGLTGALREAMATRTPVISTAIAGNGEIVRHEETGLLVPCRNPGALASAVERVLSDRYGALARAETAHAMVWAQFTAEARAAKMEKVYEEALACR